MERSVNERKVEINRISKEENIEDGIVSKGSLRSVLRVKTK